MNDKPNHPVVRYFEAQSLAAKLGLKVEVSDHDGGYLYNEHYFIQTPEQTTSKEEYIYRTPSIEVAIGYLEGYKKAKDGKN